MVTWLVLCLVGIGLPLSTAQADESDKYASIVIDAQSGRVLHAVNANRTFYPASLTKLMTLYLTFEALQKGILTLDQKLTVSKKASQMPSTKLWMHPGETLTTEEAIQAVIIRSANDAAVVLAEAIAGDEKHFAQRMTQKALDIGMIRTRFKNASGLHHSKQVSTARDMALLSRALMLQFPQYYSYFAKRSFKFRGNRIYTHNHFVKNYKGADGLKTGHISEAGYNLVASAIRNKTRLVGVVFGGKSSKWRDQHMARLMDHGFVKAKQILVAEALRQPSPKPKRLLNNKQNARLALQQAGQTDFMISHPSF